MKRVWRGRLCSRGLQPRSGHILQVERLKIGATGQKGLEILEAKGGSLRAFYDEMGEGGEFVMWEVWEGLQPHLAQLRGTSVVEERLKRRSGVLSVVQKEPTTAQILCSEGRDQAKEELAVAAVVEHAVDDVQVLDALAMTCQELPSDIMQPSVDTNGQGPAGTATHIVREGGDTPVALVFDS